jgi:hypothetical protein
VPSLAADVARLHTPYPLIVPLKAASGEIEGERFVTGPEIKMDTGSAR